MVNALRSISEGRTMIIIDHDMDSLFELVEQVTVLQEGKVLVEGTPEEIKALLGGAGSLSRRSAASMSLLEVNGLNSYYEDSHILFDVSLAVERNEVVALLGRNGAGKSTTFEKPDGRGDAAHRLHRLRRRRNRRQKSHDIALAGMQLVHEVHRRIFGSLNVEENIILAGLTALQSLAARAHLFDVSAAEGAPLQPRH